MSRFLVAVVVFALCGSAEAEFPASIRDPTGESLRREGEPSKPKVDVTLEGSRYALSAAAIEAREKLLHRCLRVRSNNTTAWKKVLFVPYWKPYAWHILGDPEHCQSSDAKNPRRYAGDVKYGAHDDSVYFVRAEDAALIENEIRDLADDLHLQYDATESNGTSLDDATAKAVQGEAVDFIQAVDAAQPLRILLPVHDKYSSGRFFHKDELAFLRSVQGSGSIDRIAFSAEILSDRIGFGRAALTAAFAGETSKSSTPSAPSSDAPKENVEKFLATGGDVGLTYELPLVYLEKRSDMPGFALLELYPKLVMAIPGLSSSVSNASAAVEPAARLHLQAFGFESTLAPYVDFTAGWAIGMGPGWREYLGMRHFGFVNMSAGLLLSNRFNVGVAYILGGPLRGQNGISITVSALTTNN